LAARSPLASCSYCAIFQEECFAVTDYVMVHGAWRGSWLWKRVRQLLAAEGHRVFTPTLTGLGERMHLLLAGKRRWWREELPCGHDVMLDMPDELAALLLQRE
jgi:hypothetical protein